MANANRSAAEPGLRQPFLLGGLEVDPLAGVVRGPAGSEYLDPKVMDVLCLLASQAGTVVAREDLFETLWPGVIVSDHALSRCIYHLRRQLSQAGASEESKALIETLPKRGYRLNGTPTPIATSAPADRTPAQTGYPVKRWMVAVVAILAVTALSSAVLWPLVGDDRRALQSGENSRTLAAAADAARERASVGLLPCVYEGTNDEAAELGARIIHGELEDRLRKLSGLDSVVVPREWTSGRDGVESIREIGREFGVSTILTCQVLETGSAFELVLSALDTETGDPRWNQSYSLSQAAGNAFDVLFNMTDDIVTVALDASLSADELSLIREPPTANTLAYNLYLTGNAYFKRSTDRRKSLSQAEEQFLAATREDPKFAQAWAHLGIVHTGIYYLGFDQTPERADKAEEAIKEAEKLDPDLPQTRLARANYLARVEGRPPEALGEFERVEAGARTADFFLHRASVYRRLGRLRESVEDLDRALDEDPTNVVFLRQQHINYEFLRDYESAQEQLDSIARYALDDARVYLDLVGLDLFSSGETWRANQYTEQPPVEDYAAVDIYVYYHWLAAIFDEDYPAATGILDESSRTDVIDSDPLAPRRPKSLFYAQTYQLAGEESKALEQFELARQDIEESLVLTEAAVPTPTTILLNLWLAEAKAGLSMEADAFDLAQQADDLQEPIRLWEARLERVLGVWLPLGYDDLALDELSAYLDAETPGRWSFEALEKDPRLARLRDDPRFAALAER